MNVHGALSPVSLLVLLVEDLREAERGREWPKRGRKKPARWLFMLRGKFAHLLRELTLNRMAKLLFSGGRDWLSCAMRRLAPTLSRSLSRREVKVGAKVEVSAPMSSRVATRNSQVSEQTKAIDWVEPRVGFGGG